MNSPLKFVFFNRLSHEIVNKCNPPTTSQEGAASNLVLGNHPGQLMADGDTLDYHCKFGMKFPSDFTQLTVQSACVGASDSFNPASITDVCVECKYFLLDTFVLFFQFVARKHSIND